MAKRKKTLPSLNRHPKTGNCTIDKIIAGHGRFCRSTGTQDYAEAERRAIKWIKEIEESSIHGKRTRLTFSEAAAIYIEKETKKSLDDDIRGLEQVMPFIGKLHLDEIHNESIQPMLQPSGQVGHPQKPRPAQKPNTPPRRPAPSTAKYA